MEPADAFLDGTLLNGQTRVLAQVLRPGLDQEHLHTTAGIREPAAWLLVVQHLMDEGDGDRSLANR